MIKEQLEAIEQSNYESIFKRVTNKDFNKYYNKFFIKLTYFIQKFGINEADAKGIANDTFMRGFEKIHQYNNKYAFSTWLFNIGKNMALQFLATHKHNILLDYNSVYSDNPDNQNNLKFYIEKKHNTNEEFDDDRSTSILNYKYKETLKAIHNLSPIYKTIILMREMECMSYEEISNELDIDLQTVKNRIHHGRKILNKELKNKFEKIYEIW